MVRQRVKHCGAWTSTSTTRDPDPEPPPGPCSRGGKGGGLAEVHSAQSCTLNALVDYRFNGQVPNSSAKHRKPVDLIIIAQLCAILLNMQSAAYGALSAAPSTYAKIRNWLQHILIWHSQILQQTCRIRSDMHWGKSFGRDISIQLQLKKARSDFSKPSGEGREASGRGSPTVIATKGFQVASAAAVSSPPSTAGTSKPQVKRGLQVMPWHAYRHMSRIACHLQLGHPDDGLTRLST